MSLSPIFIRSEEATCERMSDVDNVADDVARNTARCIGYFLFIFVPAIVDVLLQDEL